MSGINDAYFYRESGRFGIGGIIGALVGGAIVAAVLGFAYAYAIFYIPFIYLNVILSGLLGLAVGFVVGWVAKAGKVRNSKLVFLLSLIGGLLAVYFQWVAWVGIVFSDIPDVELIWNPAHLWEGIQLINETGVWGMGSSGEPVTGIVLWIVWAIELVVIVGCAIFFGRASADGVFCERCGQWAEPEPGVARLQFGPELEPAIAQMAEGQTEALKHIPPAADDDGAWAQVDLFVCKGCAEFNTINLSTVTHELDKEGKVEQKVAPLVSGLLAPDQTVADLRAAWAAPRPAPATPAESEAPPE